MSILSANETKKRLLKSGKDKISLSIPKSSVLISETTVQFRQSALWFREITMMINFFVFAFHGLLLGTSHKNEWFYKINSSQRMCFAE